MEHDIETWIPWYRQTTPTWLGLTLAERGLLVSVVMLLNSTTGEIHLRKGLASVAALIRAPWAEIETALGKLIAEDKLAWDGARFVLSDPQYLSRMRPGWNGKTTAAERMRSLRSARAAHVQNVPDVPRREEKRIEYKVTAPQAAPTDGVAEDRPKKRGMRLPTDWTPSSGTLEWARKNGIADPLAPLAEFRDYWIAVPGSRGVKLDWDATYRNRLRQIGQRGRPPEPPRAPYHRVAPVPTTKPERLTREELDKPLRALTGGS